MHYYLYQITNNLNGKIYIGVHKTQNLDDGYMGSGKVIKSAIEKYGVDNFTKIILATFENAVDMFAKEKEMVTDEFLLREDTYNLRRGGYGGFDHINKISTSEQKSKAGLLGGHATKNSPKRKTDSLTDEIRSLGGKRAQELFGNTLRELANTEEAKKKRKQTFARNGHSVGEKNSQFGSMWITDGVSNKKIKSGNAVPAGWRLGRVVNQK